MRKVIIPQFLFETEDVLTLKEKKIDFRKVLVPMKTKADGITKVKCYEFLNMDIDEVFNKLEEGNFFEASQSDQRSYASRTVAIMFLRLREIVNMKNPEDKIIGMASMIAATNSLYLIDPMYARRILPLLRAS